MNKIYQFAAILILICNIGSAGAQITSEHLVPVKGIYNIYDYQFEYYSRVRNVLFKGLTDNPEIKLQVMPSFSPENVLVIEYDKNNDKYFLNFHICDQKIWSNKKWKRVKVNKFRSEIDQASVKLIKSLFEVAIAQVRYPDKVFDENGLEEVIVMFDGTGYEFSVFTEFYGIRAGAVRSPNEGSKMGKLVAIGEQLIELAKSKKEKVSIDEDMRKSMEALTKELK